MTKTMLMADIHVEHSKAKEGRLSEEYRNVVVLDTMKKMVRDHSPDVIVVAGDLFDNYGKVEAALGVDVQKALIDITKMKEGGISILLIAGNHDYEVVKSQFFGKSIVSALFSGMETQGIYVIDETARLLTIKGINYMCIPYRETLDQYNDTIAPVVKKAIEDGITESIVSWHVGLPFGGGFKGDEDENGWITPDHPNILDLFKLSGKEKRIYAGHYHAPDDIPVGDAGTLTYIGSIMSRSRAEAFQDKRVMILDGYKEDKTVSTGLILDPVVKSLEEAKEVVLKLEQEFGKEIRHLVNVSVIMDKASSKDDFNIMCSKASDLDFKVKVDKPEGAIVNKHEKVLGDEAEESLVDKPEIERRIVLYAIREHFFKGEDAVKNIISDERFDKGKVDEKAAKILKENIIMALEKINYLDASKADEKLERERRERFERYFLTYKMFVNQIV